MSGSALPLAAPARRGTRSWFSNVTSSSTKPGSSRRRRAISAEEARCRWQRGSECHWGRDGAGPSPHPGDRDRPPARQDQVPAGRVRADAASLHAVAAAADRRGALGRAAAQAEFPPPRRAAGPGRGDRRDERHDRRPPGPPRPVSPRGAARTPRSRPAPARAPPCEGDQSIL